jgi:TolA-binding protein
VAGLVARVQAMEEEVRRLRGRVDEIDNRSQRQYADLNKQLGDLNFRLGNQATAPAVAPPPPRQVTAAEPPPVPAAPAASGIPRTPERALAEGNAALARRDYAAAEAAAREALANRISPRGYDAQFLLAEALAGKHDWAQAAVAYNDSYTRLKTGSHAQDALLGLANAMLAIGEKRSACEAVAKLGFEFPNMRPDVRGGAGALKQRAQCS